jgi:Zn-dependent M16 (insulinase) family peptidase
MFFVEATEDKYIEAITLLKESLFNVEFTEERAKTVISQLLNSIPSEKLSASKIVGSLSDNIYFNDHSIIYHASFLRQQVNTFKRVFYFIASLN